MTAAYRPSVYRMIYCTMLLLSGCASIPGDRSNHTSDIATYVLVRHAEKAADDPKDPVLSAAGEARAARLAARLTDTRVDAVFATRYRRTQLTASPTATEHGLDIRTYDPNLPASAFVAQLREAHPRGTVLIVGHSNTVPTLAEAFCACTVAPMREDEYDRLIEIRIDADGGIRIEQMSY